MTDKITAKSVSAMYTEKIILPSDPLAPLWNVENILHSKPCRWNYIDSCMMRAAAMMYDTDGDKRLADYIVRFTDAYVSDNGTIPTLNPADRNLDNFCGGRNLLWLYRTCGDEKYLRAAEMLYKLLADEQPRLECGNFYHKACYPHQLWLDGAYMALPFMAEFALLRGKNEDADDVLEQLRSIRRLMRDADSGLYYHGYDESRSAVWADKNSGLSLNFWLRSNGWLCAALADICEISADHAVLCSTAAEMLGELLEALCAHIEADGLMLQLPMLHGLNENYPETSGSLLFAYSALKFSRMGYGSPQTKADGTRVLSAVIDKYITFDSQHTPFLENICLTAGLGGMPSRDGSAEYYLSEPVVKNDAKGIAPLLMAICEQKRLSVQ